MPIHFTSEVSLGQALLAIPLSGIVIALLRIFKILLLFRMEHEILMEEWAKRNDKILNELHTRKKFWW